MSSNNLAGSYLGIPQLELLHNDLRAAELLREAPRLSLPEDQYEAMKGGSLWSGGKHYQFVDRRESRSPKAGAVIQFDDCLGTFKLETGELAFFVLLTLPAEARFGSRIPTMIAAPPRIFQGF